MHFGRLLPIALAAACLTPPSAQARIAESTIDAVRSRAQAADFSGALLIGDEDGSSRILVLGANPPRPGAVWRWASITKQLAATLVMQEVAKGRLDLEAPVRSYWPDWKAPNAGSIRIMDLLLHNSGLPQPDESPADADGVPGFYRKDAASPEASANGFCAGKARAAPPAEFEYDNCDSIVLAAVLQRVTGKDFDRLVRERLARPLGMKRFGMFSIGKPPVDHVAPTGEFSKEDAMLNLGVYGASGGAYGTIADLWRFDHALLSGRLLPNSARARMWESSRSNGFYGFHQWIFPAALAGCAKQMQVVERQGLIGGIELRNYLLPETGQAVIMFSRHRPSDFGDPWTGSGFAFDILSQVACS